MKKKGFTLIELLGVIIIMAVIAMITIPLVNDHILSSKFSAFQSSIRNLVRALEQEYARNDYEGIYYNFPLQDNSFEIDGDTSDWRGESLVDDDGFLGLSIKSGDFCAYKTIQSDEIRFDKNCKKLEIGDISFKVFSDRYDEKTRTYSHPHLSPYQEPEIKAYDRYGRELSRTITYSGDVDTNVFPGSTKMIVSATDDLNTTKTIEITIKIVDEIPPIIVVDGHSSATEKEFIKSGEAGYFVVPQGTATDNSGEHIAVRVEGNITPTIKGTYYLTYVATDSSENEARLKATYIITDKTGPEVTIVGNPTSWSSQNVTIAINAIDKGVGLHNTPYSFDGGKTWVIGNTMIVDSNKTLEVWVRDKDGNITKKTVVIDKIDKQKPDVDYNIISGIKEGTDDWYKSDVVVSVTPKAGLSGVKEYSYCVTTNNTCTPNTRVIGSGSTNVTLNTNSDNNRICTVVTSNSGVVSDVICNNPIKIDRSKPGVPNVILTLKTENGSSYNGTCTRENVFASMTSNSTSGVARFEWQENGGNWKTDSLTTTNNKGTMLFTGERISNIGFRAINKSNLIGDVINKTIKIDRTAPQIKINGCANTGNCTLTYELSQTPYKIPGSVATDNCGITTTPPTTSGHVLGNMVGSYDVTYTVTDIAGNTNTATLTVNVVDTTKPNLTYTMNPAQPNGANNWYTSGITFTTQTNDTQGIKTHQYRLSTDYGNTFGNWIDITNNQFTVSTEGARLVVEMRAVDYSRNEITAKTGTLKIDIKNPVISSITGNPTSWTNKDVTLIVYTNSDVSGIQDYSFDNGITWQTSNQKTFSSNQTVNIKVRDYSGRISTVSTVAITKIDKVPPVITVEGHTSNFTKEIVTTEWITEEQLRALGYKPGDAGVTSKIQYGYQPASYSATNVKQDNNAGSYAPWYKNVYKYNYNYNKRSNIQNFDINKNSAGAQEVWSINAYNWHIVYIVLDIDLANSNNWSNYYQPKVEAKCGGRTIYTMPENSNVTVNGTWRGDYFCNEKVSFYSHGNTGSGRNWTGSGGANYIEYYVETSSVSNWVFDKSEIKDAISVGGVSATGYVTASFGTATGWRFDTPYTSNVNQKSVSRTVYKIAPTVTIPEGTATDNATQNLVVERSGIVNPAIEGTYDITYTTVDAAGNKKTLVLTYRVVKK